MHLQAIPPDKVQKSPPLNVQSYTRVSPAVFSPLWWQACLGQVCAFSPHISKGLG